MKEPSPVFTAKDEDPLDDLEDFKYYIAPKSVVWELTGACALDCPYCFEAYPKIKRDEISGAARIALARELAEAKIFAINLSGGEPLMCKELPEIVDIFKEYNIPVLIVTSGYGLTRELAVELMKHPELGFMFTVEAADAETHDYLRGRQGSLDKVLKGVELVKELGASSSIKRSGGPVGPVAILGECVVTQKNLDSVADLISLCERSGFVHLRVQPVVMVGGKVTNLKLDLSIQDLQKLWKTVTDYINGADVGGTESRARMQVRLVNQVGHIVHGVKKGRNIGGIILPDGCLKVSAYLPYTFGKLERDGSFMDLWRKGFKGAWKHPELVRHTKGIKTIKDLEKIANDYAYKDVELSLTDIPI